MSEDQKPLMRDITHPQDEPGTPIHDKAIWGLVGAFLALVIIKREDISPYAIAAAGFAAAFLPALLLDLPRILRHRKTK